ncbi:MAG: DUF4263 domain-containing protein [Chloroflexota bacterium]|nr:DUF4263 domain-containing protein [Chloroflexota bacterium]
MKIQKARGYRENYPKGLLPPIEYLVEQHSLLQSQYLGFKSLIEKDAGETEIDNYIKDNKAVLANALNLFQTGHQGAWILPQQMVKPPSLTPGQKPDFIVGGRNSDGINWFIIDLKGANENIFVENGPRIYLSSTANKGVFQVLDYINECSRSQEYLRDRFDLTDFREPQGLLILGRERELINNDRRRDLKAAWNRTTNGKLQIRTYDALLRTLENRNFLREDEK